MGSSGSCMQRQSSPKSHGKSMFNVDPKSIKSSETKSLKKNEQIITNIVNLPSSNKLNKSNKSKSKQNLIDTTVTTDNNTEQTTNQSTNSEDAGVNSTTVATTNNQPVDDQSQQPSNDLNAGSELEPIDNNNKSNNNENNQDAGNNGNSNQSNNNESNQSNQSNDSNQSEDDDTESEYKHNPEQEKLYSTSMMNLSDLNHYAPISGLAERTVYKQYIKESQDGNNKSNFKKVIKEIRTSLPENITVSWNGSMFIRYDEDYPQFLQCILTGLIDTPYENGIFLFDIYLDPKVYPENAPKIQHTTKGATLVSANNGPGGFSPNLHKSTGKVCLSLLGTWNEGAKWDSNKSNIYQVLSTILFMIFGSKYPYYMEPGYGGWEGDAPQKDHEYDVIEYNEELYYGTIKYCILDVLKTPYKGFEKVIKNHFKLKKDEILNCIENKWITKGSKQLKDKLNPLLVELKQEFKKLDLLEDNDDNVDNVDNVDNTTGTVETKVDIADGGAESVVNNAVDKEKEAE